MDTGNKSNDIVRAFAQCRGIPTLALKLSVARLEQTAQELLLHRSRLIEDLRRFEGGRATPKRAATLQLNRRMAVGGVQ